MARLIRPKSTFVGGNKEPQFQRHTDFSSDLKFEILNFNSNAALDRQFRWQQPVVFSFYNSAGIFGAASVLVLDDLSRGTGRYHPCRI
jgi:hypothetical protein